MDLNVRAIFRKVAKRTWTKYPYNALSAYGMAVISFLHLFVGRKAMDINL